MHADLFVPNAAFETLVKQLILQLEEPAAGCVRTVSEELKLLLRDVLEISKEIGRFDELRERVWRECMSLLSERTRATGAPPQLSFVSHPQQPLSNLALGDLLCTGLSPHSSRFKQPPLHPPPAPPPPIQLSLLLRPFPLSPLSSFAPLLLRLPPPSPPSSFAC